MFVVDAKILDRNEFKVAIVELTPDRTPADRKLIETRAKAAINALSEESIREINGWQAKHQRY